MIGKELEEAGVLSESDFWGSHMLLVCPDGVVVAYAWKRQLAGQAGASVSKDSLFAVLHSVSTTLTGFLYGFRYPACTSDNMDICLRNF